MTYQTTLVALTWRDGGIPPKFIVRIAGNPAEIWNFTLKTSVGHSRCNDLIDEISLLSDQERLAVRGCFLITLYQMVTARLGFTNLNLHGRTFEGRQVISLVSTIFMRW